jgi:hypothetical protein
MVSLSSVPEFALVSNAHGQQLTLNLRVRAPELAQEDESKRSPVSLSMVLDKSGSMAGSKLALVKRTCRFVLGQLGRRDKLGVVEYDSEVLECVPLSQTSELFRREAAIVISSMCEGSCTNLSGGLFLGVGQQKGGTYIDWDGIAPSASAHDAADWVLVDDDASSVSSTSSLVDRLYGANLQTPCRKASGALQSPIKRARNAIKSREIFGGVAAPPAKPIEGDAVRSVFLFTDGMANVGLRDEALIAATKQLLDCETPIRLFAFGFGSDHSEQLLSELAAAGQGQYYYIEKEDQIPTAFADALGGLLSVSAQNVVLDLTPADGVTIEKLYTPFQTSTTPTGCRIKCGDILSEEHKDLLVDVILPAFSTDQEADYKIGTLKASYFDVVSTSQQICQIDIIVRRASEVPDDLEPNLQVSLQHARVDTAAALTASSQIADTGDLQGARLVLEQRLQQVMSLVSTAQRKGDAIVASIAGVLVEDLEEALRDARDLDVYRSHGSKSMRMKGACRSAQRCSFLTPVSLASQSPDGCVEGCSPELNMFISGSAKQRSMKSACPAPQMQTPHGGGSE